MTLIISKIFYGFFMLTTTILCFAGVYCFFGVFSSAISLYTIISILFLGGRFSSLANAIWDTLLQQIFGDTEIYKRVTDFFGSVMA